MKQETSKKKIKLIIGLGNPTDEYRHTYHNVGRLLLEYLYQHLPEDWTALEPQSPKKSFAYRKIQDDRGHTYLCVEPLLFMNESGRALHEALSFFKMPLSSVLVIHDDSDQTIGSYKISYNQRSAGHKGIESIIQECGSQEFSRGKIGIRPAQEITRKKANEFVLKKISKKDITILEKEVFPKIATLLFSTLSCE